MFDWSLNTPLPKPWSAVSWIFQITVAIITLRWILYQYTVLDIQFRSVNYTLAARICKNFEQNKYFIWFSGKKLQGKRFRFQNVQREIFEIFKIIKNNIKLTTAACWINSEVRNGDNNTTLIIFLKAWYTVELHFLISLKAKCSNVACFSKRQTFSISNMSVIVLKNTVCCVECKITAFAYSSHKRAWTWIS